MPKVDSLKIEVYKVDKFAKQDLKFLPAKTFSGKDLVSATDEKGQHYYKFKVKKNYGMHRIHFSAPQALNYEMTTVMKPVPFWMLQFVTSTLWVVMIDLPTGAINIPVHSSKFAIQMPKVNTLQGKPNSIYTSEYKISLEDAVGKKIYKNYKKDEDYPELARSIDTLLSQHNLDLRYAFSNGKDIDIAKPRLNIKVELDSLGYKAVSVPNQLVNYKRPENNVRIQYMGSSDSYEYKARYKLSLMKGKTVAISKSFRISDMSRFPDFLADGLQRSGQVAMYQFLADEQVRKLLLDATEANDTKRAGIVINTTKALKTELMKPEALKSTVVLITSKEGHGSGFFLDNNGHIMTNNHVVDGQDTVTVYDNAGNRYLADVVAFDGQKDLALLKIKDAKNIAFVKLGDSELIDIGDEVIAIGNPVSTRLSASVSKGILSSRRELMGMELLQIDAAVNGGNSGGPLFNQSGHLVGVVNAKVQGDGAEGLGFAIPAKNMLEFLAAQKIK